MKNNRDNSGYPGRRSAYGCRKRHRRRRTALISAILITAAALAALALYINTDKGMMGQSDKIYASEGNNEVLQKPDETNPENERGTDKPQSTETNVSGNDRKPEVIDSQPNKVKPNQNTQGITDTEAEGTKSTDTEGAYDFTQPVPESDKVDESYFDDAVFIGDSRTEGFINASGLSNTTAYAQKGLMVDSVFTSPVIDMNGSKVTVMEALERTSFNKVYVMLGINETGWPYESVFIDKYKILIDKIKEINPSAKIYIQSILPVSSKVSSTHSYVKNEKISQYNELIQAMTEEENVYYVNVREAVADSSGALPEEAAVDGIHLKKDYSLKWLEYLEKHTVS